MTFKNDFLGLAQIYFIIDIVVKNILFLLFWHFQFWYLFVTIIFPELYGFQVYQLNTHTYLSPASPFLLLSSLSNTLLPFPHFFLFPSFLKIFVIVVVFSVINVISCGQNVYFFPEHICENSDSVSGIWILTGSQRQCTGRVFVHLLQRPERVCFYFTCEDTACRCLA